MLRPPQLGDLLASVGIISKEQLAGALEYQKEYGGLLGQALVRLGACTESEIQGALDAQRQNTALSDRLAVIKAHSGSVSPGDGQESERAWRYLQLAEREMRRLARDVQDVVAVLGEAGLQAEAARMALAATPASEALVGLRERLGLLARELGAYAAELAPPGLDAPQLLIALREYSGYYYLGCQGTLALTVDGDTFGVSRLASLGLFRAIQHVLRGVASSDGSHDVAVSLGRDGEDAVVAIEFEAIRTRDRAVGDPIGEACERVQLLGGRMDRAQEGDLVTLTFRAPAGASSGQNPGAVLVT